MATSVVESSGFIGGFVKLVEKGGLPIVMAGISIWLLYASYTDRKTDQQRYDLAQQQFREERQLDREQFSEVMGAHTAALAELTSEVKNKCDRD